MKSRLLIPALIALFVLPGAVSAQGSLSFSPVGKAISGSWPNYTKKIYQTMDANVSVSLQYDSHYRPYGIEIQAGTITGDSRLPQLVAYTVYFNYSADLTESIESYAPYMNICYKAAANSKLFQLVDGSLVEGPELPAEAGLAGYVSLTPVFNSSKLAKAGKKVLVGTFLVLGKAQTETLANAMRSAEVRDFQLTVKDLPFNTSGDEQYALDYYKDLYGSRPQIVPFANADGTTSVAWAGKKGIHLSLVSADFTLKSDVVLATEWEIFGGFTRDSAGNCYVLTGKNNKDGDFSSNLRVVKYDAKGKKLKVCDIPTSKASGFDVMNPFDWASGRLVCSEGKVYVHMGKVMHKHTDGLNHQSAIFVTIDTATMKVLMKDSMKQTAAHSFNQEMTLQGSDPVILDLADNYPRGILITKPGFGSRVIFTYKTQHGTTEANPAGNKFGVGKWSNDTNTYASLGGLTATDDGFIVLASSEVGIDNSLAKGQHNSSRNLFMVRVAPDFWTKSEGSYKGNDEEQIVSPEVVVSNGETSTLSSFYDFNGGRHYQQNVGVIWLTAYSDTLKENAVRPKLINMGDGRIVALYELWSEAAYRETRYLIFDAEGNITQEDRSIGNERLQRGDNPVRVGGSIVWFTGDPSSSRLVAHVLKPVAQEEN